MSAVKQLFSPLNYLRISHPLKIRFDLFIPLCISLFITVVFWYLPEKVSIFGDKALIDSVSGILQLLTGFFIASLAAVSTFQSDSLDKQLSGDPAILDLKIKGKKIQQNLSRRRFLSYLFGYLSLLSIFLYFLGLFANLLLSNALLLLPDNIEIYAKWVFIFIYLFLLSNLITTTLLGLHYMADRIHR